MRNYPRTLLLAVICAVILSFASFSRCHAQCEAVIDHIKRINTLIQQLPPYPGNEEAAKVLLHESVPPPLTSKIIAIIEEDNYLQDHNTQWARCFVDNTGLMDLNILSWRQFLSGSLVAPTFRSSEFVRGAGLHLDVNQGVADLGGAREGYTFATRALFTYTFVRKSIPSGTGGKVRLLGGPSFYYTNRDWMVLGNLRMEYRLKDIGGKQFSIGNIKLIADANSDLDMWIVGGGLGIEVYNFGVQMLYQRQNEIKHSQTLVGLFYRFSLSKH